MVWNITWQIFTTMDLEFLAIFVINRLQQKLICKRTAKRSTARRQDLAFRALFRDVIKLILKKRQSQRILEVSITRMVAIISNHQPRSMQPLLDNIPCNGISVVKLQNQLQIN